MPLHIHTNTHIYICVCIASQQAVKCLYHYCSLFSVNETYLSSDWQLEMFTSSPRAQWQQKFCQAFTFSATRGSRTLAFIHLQPVLTPMSACALTRLCLLSLIQNVILVRGPVQRWENLLLLDVMLLTSNRNSIKVNKRLQHCTKARTHIG